MQYEQGLIPATLIKRYKRFLADVRLDNDQVVTVHCANTGAMTGCAEEGDLIWLWDSQNPKRKLPLSWEWTERQGHRMCINTARMNGLVKDALLSGALSAVSEGPLKPSALKSEPVIVDSNEQGRLDFCIETRDGSSCAVFIEVKSVTLLISDDGLGAFPDAVTARGLKHVRVLSEKAQQGQRAILLFCVAHEGIQRVGLAEHIDPKYATAVKEAHAQGVEVLAYRVAFTNTHTAAAMTLAEAIPVML